MLFLLSNISAEMLDYGVDIIIVLLKIGDFNFDVCRSDSFLSQLELDAVLTGAASVAESALPVCNAPTGIFSCSFAEVWLSECCSGAEFLSSESCVSTRLSVSLCFLLQDVSKAKNKAKAISILVFMADKFRVIRCLLISLHKLVT
jgi:hypothetical protein